MPSSSPASPTCRTTKIPKLILSPCTPVSSSPSSPRTPSSAQRTILKPKLKSFIPRRNDKRKYEATIIPDDNNNPAAAQRVPPPTPPRSSTFQLSEPISRVNSDDVSFVGEPINLEVERVRAALVGLIPPVQSTISMERMKQKLDSSPSHSHPLLNPIVEDVLKTLADEETLLEGISPPSSYLSFVNDGDDDEVDTNLEQSPDVNNNLDDDGKALPLAEASSNRKLNWATDFIFRRDTEDIRMVNSSPDNSIQNMMSTQQPPSNRMSSSSNKAKTIFSLRPPPPMTRSKIVPEPKANGDHHSEKRLKQEQVLKSPSQQSRQSHEKVEVQEIPEPTKIGRDLFEMNFDPMSMEMGHHDHVEDHGDHEDFVEELEEEDESSKESLPSPSQPPCRAILYKEGTLILQRDPSPKYSKRKMFRATVEIENVSSRIYGFMIHCNYPALNHFYITPRKGLIQPESFISVTIKGKECAENYLTTEAAASDRIEIKYFPGCCSDDVRQMENCFNKLSLQCPEQILTQKIDRFVIWDGGDFLRINDLLASSTSKMEQERLLSIRKNLYDQYAELILPQERAKGHVNSLRNKMLLANQDMKAYLGRMIRVRKALHILAFVCIYVPAFVMILPFLETNVIFGESIMEMENSPPANGSGVVVPLGIEMKNALIATEEIKAPASLDVNDGSRSFFSSLADLIYLDLWW